MDRERLAIGGVMRRNAWGCRDDMVEMRGEHGMLLMRGRLLIRRLCADGSSFV